MAGASLVLGRCRSLDATRRARAGLRPHGPREKPGHVARSGRLRCRSPSRPERTVAPVARREPQGAVLEDPSAERVLRESTSGDTAHTKSAYTPSRRSPRWPGSSIWSKRSCRQWTTIQRNWYKQQHPDLLKVGVLAVSLCGLQLSSPVDDEDQVPLSSLLSSWGDPLFGILMVAV